MYKSSYKSQIKDVTDKGEVDIGVNAIGNVDSDDDMSMPGSFDKTIKEFFQRVKWFYNHNKTQLLGVPLEAKEEGSHLRVVAKFNMKKELSRDVYEDYKLYAEHGRTLEHSVGVNAVKYEMDEMNGIRKVYEWKWWEFSTLSSWGANEDTPLMGLKSMNTDQICREIDFLNKSLKMNYTDERFKEIEQTIIKLKSLIGEPEDSTLNNEPIVKFYNLLNF